MNCIASRRRSSSFGCIAAWLGALTPLAAVVPAQSGVAYLFETGRMELARYDLASGSRRAITQGLGGPGQVAVHGRFAWVVEKCGELSRVELATGAITTVAIGLGEPFGLALQPTTGDQLPRVVYMAEGRGQSQGRLIAVDTGTNAITTIASGLSWSPDGGDIAIRPDGATVYGSQSFGGVIAIDVVTGARAVVPGTEWARNGIAVSSDGDTLYFYDWVWSAVSAADLTSPTPSAVRTDLGGALWATPTSLALSSDGSRAAFAFDSVHVQVIDTSAPGLPLLTLSFRLNVNSVTFQDADTVLLTNANGGIFAVDVPTGAITAVDAGLHYAEDLEVVESTAYIREVGSGRADRIMAVDLGTGDVSTVKADGLWGGSGLHASRDGSHLFFLQRVWNGSEELVDFDLTTAVARSIASFPNFPHGFVLDDLAGYAYVSVSGANASSLARIHLATGLTTDVFWAPQSEFGYLTDFGVDYAAARAVGRVALGGGHGLGVVGFGSGQAWLQESVPFPSTVELRRSQPSADGRSCYSAIRIKATNEWQLVATEMMSPSHPQSVLLTTGDGISAMRVLNTADGPGVVATLVDPMTGAAPVTLTFDEVVGSGDSTLTTSTTGPAVPAGFQLGGAGVYYEIATTAEFRGTVEICVDYSGTTFADESTLQLLHFEHGAWVNVTTTRDPTTNRICGVVRSFSPFVVVEWPAMNALNDLVNRVQNLDVRHGIVVSLDAKLTVVRQALVYALQGNGGAAVNCVRAFIQEVRAQSGGSLPVDTADGLIADAEGIIALLGG